MSAPPLCEPSLPEASPPRSKVPRGACDCHFHIFGPPSRQVDGRKYTAPDASAGSYKHLQQTLGLDRCVIVQPSVYGSDNRTTLQALSPDPNVRAVVVVGANTGASELQEYARQGAVGARVNLLFPSDAALAQLNDLATVLADLGWHLQVLADLSTQPELTDRVARLPLPVVFDHMGHVPAYRALQNQGFQSLLSHLVRGDVWVKLSAAYRVAPDDMTQAGPMARALIAANSDQLVWGSDWPHPAIAGRMPDDGALLDLLFDWAGQDIAERVLVRNPEKLYGFETWEGIHAPHA